MRICHACQRELDAASLAQARCVHCGALIHTLSQRTIEDKHFLRRPSSQSGDEIAPGVSASDNPADDSLSLEITDSSSVPTYEIEVPLKQIPDAPETSHTTARPSDPERKSPTVADRADMTIEYAPPADAAAGISSEAAGGSQDKPARRSTHTFESDATIDLGISAADAEHISLQWGGTFAKSSHQGQTIRQKETVTGFRASLPVKSRYVRSRETTSSGKPSLRPPAEVPDYELLDIIGEGGMGVVYAAHQSSIARTVAVKMLKPSSRVGEEQRDKFISEAVVTGELDHPNIVPIYDLGANDEGALFYSMKRVRGTPWDKVIGQKRLDENLNILLRVADAVAFAHAGGVIHRDLKPENVMLGDYGEVLVMDWGLARITPEFAHADTVFQADSLGGTPAYMAPEMARGPIEAINKTSDVYLLGAILYEVIGGLPPHSGRDVMQCLMAASQNRIDPIRYDGELKEIALKAMASRQADRYQSVKEFQEAVRVYQSHSESLVLTAHANQNLQKAREAGDYALFARALYGFQESLTLWSENVRAGALLSETQIDYAKCALGKGDLDLAASLLDANKAEHQSLLADIDAARADRDARARRLKYAKRMVAGLVATVLITITIAFFNIRAAKNEAVAQKDIAVEAKEQEAIERQKAEAASVAEAEARKLAEEQEKIARDEERKAKEQEAKAREEERKAIVARADAEKAQEAEAYEAYVASIGLAAAKINDNAYDFALQLLAEAERPRRNWEWGRLAYLTQLSAGNFDTGAHVDAVAFSRDGNSFVTGDWGGNVTVRDAKTGEVRWQVPHGTYVHSVAYSPDGSRIASGSIDKTILILDAKDGRELARLPGHKGGVLSVRFSPDGRQLVSSSYDQTARVWDLESLRTLQELIGHSWWVWAADFSPDAQRIVTAGQDGKAIIWQKGAAEQATTTQVSQVRGPSPTVRGQFAIDRGQNAATNAYAKLTEFTGHDGAVYSARFSPTGDLVATGGYDKQVMLWDPDEVQPVDIKLRLAGEEEPQSNYLRLSGHDGPVRSVAFSPNGTLVLSGGEENTIRLWDAASGDPLKTLRGHGNAVRSCAFSPDGRWVISGSQDERVRLWDVEGYQEVRVLRAKVLDGHDDAVLSARFSKDGTQIITASRDRSAVLWDAATAAQLRRFAEGHEFLTSSAVFFQDGRRMATGAGDNSVRIWDITSGGELAAFTGTGRIGAVAVSTDGKWIVTGSQTTDALVWDTQARKPSADSNQVPTTPIATLGGHVAEVSAMAFSPDGDRLVTGDDRGQLRVWRRGAADADWQFERKLVAHNGGITGIRFLPGGKRLVTASGDRSCGQWDLDTGEELRNLVLKHPDWVSSLDVSVDGRFALTTCEDGSVRLWRLADAQMISIQAPVDEKFNAASFSPDGRTAVVTSSAARKVYLWNLKSGALQAEADGDEPLLDFNQLGGTVWAAIFAPDGKHILSIGGNDAQLWNIDSRRPTVAFSSHGAVASADVSPDGRLVATGSWDHSAKIWDAATGAAIRKLDGGHGDYINSVEFSPDGSELLTASDDRTARLWNVTSGKPIGNVFAGHTGGLLAATFSPPQADRVLTTSGDKTARIWERASGKQIKMLEGHTQAVLCGLFSPDGERIITGSEDNTAKIWKRDSDEEPLTLEGHTAAITSVAFSPDGTRALTGSRDATAKLWDSMTGKEILSLPGHSEEVTSVSFSPDGLSVMTSSRDGKVIIWPAADWHDDKPLRMARGS